MHRATNHFYDGIPYEDLVSTSHTSRQLLRVVLLGKEIPAGTDWWGASAWVANSTWQRRYKERKDE